MSTATSRKLPADVLGHPDIVALIEQGKATGHVTADALRTATEAATQTPAHLKALLRHLSELGINVVVSADEPPAIRKKVAAASSTRSTVKATAKKSAAKKAPAKKAEPEAAKKAPAKKAAAKK